MAIFGNLRDMPLLDLLSMLGRRSGLLEVWNLPGEQDSYLLALERGRLLWVKANGRRLDALQARSCLFALASAAEGAFEFVPTQPPEENPHLDWPLERLLLSVTSTQDEISQQRSLLPDPATRFQSAALEVWLEEPLYSFWQRARPLLDQGASARELAHHLNISLDEVRYYLHRLRLAGRVAPVRAYQALRKDEARQGLFQRLLAALRGRGKGR